MYKVIKTWNVLLLQIQGQDRNYKMTVTLVSRTSNHQTVLLAAVGIKFKTNSRRVCEGILLLIGCIDFVFMPALCYQFRSLVEV